MRFITLRRSAVAAAAAGLASVSFTAVAEPASAELAPSVVTLVPSPNTTVVESVSLPNNVVLLRTAGGSLVIGPSDLQLTVVNDEAGSRLGVAVPDPTFSATPGWTVEAMEQVLDTAHGGVSLEDIADRADDFIVGVNATEPAYNAACANAADDVQYTKTCTTRQAGYNDGTNKYVGSKTFTYGQINSNARDFWELYKITNTDNYERGTQLIVDFTPNATQYGSNCTNTQFSLTGYGVSLQLSKPLCPRQLDPYHFSTIEQFKTTWIGAVSGAASAYQIETVKAPAASESWLVFSGTSESRPKCVNIACMAYQFIFGP